jgi:hypothetical protein
MFYQLRTALAYRVFNVSVRSLDDTPSLRADETAGCEVHTMLGSADVTMYILAVKSLLSYVRTLSVVVHSDGTLSAADYDRIARHVAGVRFVTHQEADGRAREALARTPLLAEWRRVDAAYRRLIDIELWRTRDRVIILDSDVLTTGRPDEVIGWVQSGSRPFLLGQPPAEGGGGGKPSRHVQAQFLAKVPGSVGTSANYLSRRSRLVFARHSTWGCRCSNGAAISASSSTCSR